MSSKDSPPKRRLGARRNAFEQKSHGDSRPKPIQKAEAAFAVILSRDMCQRSIKTGEDRRLRQLRIDWPADPINSANKLRCFPLQGAPVDMVLIGELIGVGAQKKPSAFSRQLSAISQ